MKTSFKFNQVINDAGKLAPTEGHTDQSSSPRVSPCGLLSFKGDIVKTRKATHLGTCQVCGRVQKLPNGRLSIHGYTKRFGFFAGACRGECRLPFEESHDVIDSAIQNAKNLIECHRDAIRRLEVDGSAKIWKICYNQKGQPWKEFAFTIDGNYLRAEGQSSIFLRGRSVEDCVIEENSSRVRFLHRTIAELGKYIAWQEDRVANWKPGKIIPIEAQLTY